MENPEVHRGVLITPHTEKLPHTSGRSFFMKPTLTRILYLDDNGHFRIQVREILQQEPETFELTEAGSSAEFEALLTSKKFDLVLCEVNLPGLPNLDVLKKVKVYNARLPVIILTGSQNGQLGVESIQLGAADLIIKSPVTLSILSHKIRMVMDRIQAEEKRRESEMRYNDMIRRTPMGVYIIRAKPGLPGEFEYISSRCCEILGLKADEVLANADVVDMSAHPDDREEFSRSRKASVMAGQTFVWEGRFIVAGELRWVRIESEPMILPDGDILWNGVVVDFTGRKQTEQSLRESEAINQAIISQSPIGIAVFDPLGKPLSANASWKKIWSISDEEFQKEQQREFTKFVFEEWDEYLQAHQHQVRQVYEKGGSLYLPDLRIPHSRPGSAEWVSKYYYAIMDEQGQVKSVVNLTEDISSRKKAERELRNSEALNHAIISGSPIGIAVFNSVGAPLFGNASWKKIWGLSEEEYHKELQREFKELGFDEWDEYLQDHIDQVIQVYAKGGSLYLPDLKITNPLPGSAEWVSQYYFSIMDEQGRVERVITLTEDISARKKAEAEIIKSRAMLARVQEVAHLGSVEINLTTQTVISSTEARRIYGWDKEVLSLADVQAFALPEYRAEIDAALEKLVHLRQEFNIQYKIKRKSDGAIRDIQALAEYNAEENTVVGSIQDITERKLIMQVLMENEEKFRTLFEHANDMIFIFDMNDRIFDVNKRTCDLLGYSRDELLKLKVTDLQAPQVRGSVGTTLKNDFKKYGNKVYESVGVRKDRTTFPVEVTLSKITIASGIRFFAVVRDISERKHIE